MGKKKRLKAAIKEVLLEIRSEPARAPNIAEQLMARLAAAGAHVQGVKVHRLDPVTGQVVTDATAGAIKPPPDVTDSMSWGQWHNFMEAERLEGWAPCRFGNQTPDGRLGLVFGVAWRDYGLWRKNWPVCYLESEVNDEKADNGELSPNPLLTSLTFLPTGTSLGVFDKPETAALAAEISYREIKRDMAITQDVVDAVRARWKFHGIVPSMHLHAHQGPMQDGSLGEEMPVYTAVDIAEGKPEQLA